MNVAGAGILPAAVSAPNPANVDAEPKRCADAREPSSNPAIAYAGAMSYDNVFLDGVTTNFFQLGSDFEAFAYRMNAALDAMRSIRPDIIDQDYDVVHEQGRLRVVDSNLDPRSIIWLEESLNGDRELVQLAGRFNDQVVRTFDTERGRRDESGVLHRIGDGYTDNGARRDYSGLSQTVGRTTKFISLLRDIESIDLTLFPADNRFCRTGIYMEKYIEKDIIQYQPGASGSVDVVRSIKGPSMFGWVDMVG